MSILGPYWSPTHWYAQDEDYIRRLDPAWVLIHQPTARAIWLVHQAARNARIMLRSWDIDDSNGERKREMYADPRTAAQKHLAMWRAKWEELEDELKRNGWAYDTNNWYLQLVNEPDPAYVPQMVEYSLEAMSLVKGTLIRLGVVVSSVGTFSKPSENDQGWTKCIPLEKPINDGGHILVAHEYWQPEGPNFGEDAGNLAWRHHIIPLDVPILIGEAGANGYIYGRYSKDDDSGWQKTVKDPAVYAAQTKEYIEGCDQRVKGVLLYMLDFHDDQWWSFNTGPAMEQLLAIKDAHPQVPSPFATPIDTHLPSVIAGAPYTMFVDVPAGANLRSKPVTGAILTAVPYAEQVMVQGTDSKSGWRLVQYGNVTGWMAPMLLSAREPEPSPGGSQDGPTPSTPTSGILDPRVLQAILAIESGGHTHGENGKPIIRFEAHLFERMANDIGVFRFNAQKPWTEQQWRKNPAEPWRDVHTGKQADEYAAFEFAKSINREAAYESISMGAGQILGINHARIGYPSAEAMYNAFQSAPMQTIGFINYFLSDPELMGAMRRKDFREVARRYNGSGQVDLYAGLIEKAYEELSV